MSKKFMLASCVVVIIVVIAVVVMIIWIQNTVYSTQAENVKVIASVIVFSGGLITTIVSFFGILFKHSIDLKNVQIQNEAESRLRVESQKNNDLKMDAEKRLKLEAAIKAIELLSLQKNISVTQNQRAAVLHMLVNLEMLELALSLLKQMLSNKEIDNLTASTIIDAGLNSDIEEIQSLSANILRDNAKIFITNDGGYEVPNTINIKWPLDKSTLVREALKEAIMKIILSNKYLNWDQEYLNSILYTLNIIRKTEKDNNIRNGITKFMKLFISVFDKDSIIHAPHGSLEIRSLTNDLQKEELGPCIDSDEARIQLLTLWCKDSRTSKNKK